MCASYYFLSGNLATAPRDVDYADHLQGDPKFALLLHANTAPDTICRVLGDVRVLVLGPDYVPDFNLTDTAPVTRDPARTCVADDNIASDSCFSHPLGFADDSIVTYNAGESVGAWVVTSGSVKRQGRKAYGAPNCCLFTLELRGNSPGTIAQTLWTTPGHYYEVSFGVSYDMIRSADVGITVLQYLSACGESF